MTTAPERVPEDGDPVPERDGASTDAAPALSVRGLSKTFGDGDEAVRAVDGVSLDVDPGTVVGVLGPNGAGKTTLIKSILGLVVADEGDVRVAGTDVYGDPQSAYARVGAMLEGARNVYWRLTVRENLEYFAAIGGESPAAVRDRHGALLDQLSLAEKADTPVNDLSRGQKQKVSLACALARDVEVAFLDEPTLGLDVASSVDLRREIRRLADQEETTIVLSSHDMDVVQEICDRVVIMADGEVVADDAVEDLIDVFRTFAYRVVAGRAGAAAGADASIHEGTDPQLADDTRERLREVYGVDEFERLGDRTAFEVSLGDPERLYDLMDELRAADLTVYEVESVDPDLEEVFLELTSGEGAGPASDPGGPERAARVDGGDRP
ncbi:ABC transporter ATP-binding protein [Halosimplex halophilum]|uniref:ABC transporter ATP-binding protein n=1 Tax=Halosimplex halophilum TaxID=2559572 RepID=UPI00107F82BC|nr:ABC transporter ATP-binding protein [Halosimplex halophilum]